MNEKDQLFFRKLSKFLDQYLEKKTFYKKKKPGTVYVLLLEQCHVYVGISHEVEKRIANHFENPSVSFMSEYRPLELVRLIDNTNKQFESELTKVLMIEFGVNAVRGGPYTQREMYDYQPAELADFKLSEFSKFEKKPEILSY